MLHLFFCRLPGITSQRHFDELCPPIVVRSTSLASMCIILLFDGLPLFSESVEAYRRFVLMRDKKVANQKHKICFTIMRRDLQQNFVSSLNSTIYDVASSLMVLLYRDSKTTSRVKILPWVVTKDEYLAKEQEDMLEV